MRGIILFGVLCLFAVASVGVVAAQEVKETPKMTGTWEVSVINKDGIVKEQWVLQQTGNEIKGTVKGAQGEKPFEGTLTGGTGVNATVASGDVKHLVRLIVLGNEFDGTISVNTGRDGKFNIVRGKRGT